MEATGEAMNMVLESSFEGVEYNCPNCQWKVTMTVAAKWEMRKIDKVMNKHIHWCKREQ